MGFSNPSSASSFSAEMMRVASSASAMGATPSCIGIDPIFMASVGDRFFSAIDAAVPSGLEATSGMFAACRGSTEMILTLMSLRVTLTSHQRATCRYPSRFICFDIHAGARGQDEMYSKLTPWLRTGIQIARFVAVPSG